MSPWTLAYAVLVVLGAAVVRGFAGFGFSLLTITALSLVVAPVEVIASIFLLEVAASINLLIGSWREVKWRPVGLLSLGTALGTPLGVWALAHVPEAPMRVALGLLVLVVVGLLWRGFALASAPGPLATLATGGAAGALNGAFGIGGPPAILFFFASPAGMAAGRASLIAYFIATDVIGLGFQLRSGLITTRHVWQAALFLPPLLLGIWIGRHAFARADPEVFRRIVLALLAAMAVAIAAQGWLSL